MYRPLASRATDSQSQTTSANSPSHTALIILIVSVVTVFLLAAVYIFIRSIRVRYSNPKYIPTRFLKARWRSWKPHSIYGRVANKNSGGSLHNRVTSYNPSISTTEPTLERSTEVSAAVNGIDRNTSIRSVITLPAYNPTLNPSERLIAREGERAGIDTVIEFPETTEEEEARREEDMESLFQIRQARRREIEEREERRLERQAAREAGDWGRVEQLRLQSQLRARARAESAASATSSTGSLNPTAAATASASLILEHNARTGSRDRRISSVSYAELGLARHDGSRLRADSIESNDTRPLLDSAASMGGDGSRRNSSSLSQPARVAHHHRATSAESFASADSDLQHELTPQSSAHGSDPPPPLSLQTQTQPPEYDQVAFDPREEAPPYISPVAESGAAVPAIHVTGTTPANSVPATPIDPPESERRGR